MASINAICKSLNISDERIIKRAESIRDMAYQRCTNLQNNIFAVPAASVDIAAREIGMDIDQSILFRQSCLTHPEAYKQVVSTMVNILNLSVVPSSDVLFKKYHCERQRQSIYNYINKYNEKLISSLPLELASQVKPPSYLVPVFIYLLCRNINVPINFEMILKDSSLTKEAFETKCEEILSYIPELQTKKNLNKMIKEQKQEQKNVFEEVRNRLKNGEQVRSTEAIDEKRKKMIEKSVDYLEWKKRVLNHKQNQQSNHRKSSKYSKNGKQKIEKQSYSLDKKEKESLDDSKPIKQKQLSLHDLFH